MNAVHADTQLFAPSLGLTPGSSRLAGRHVLVVGGGQRSNGEADEPVGNGRAMCQLFAREGAAVACADVNAAAAVQTVALITTAGGHALSVVADVAEPAQIERMLTEAMSGLGGLDGLVINVGIGAGQPLAGLTAELWDRVMAVNLRAHMLIARAALPVMAAGGAIVFISSIAAHSPASREPVYEASKAALIALSRAVALDGQARGIRANVLSPGLIDTPLGRSASAKRPGRAARPLPFGRQGKAWEVAEAALFLISTAASYVNAHELIVDGGLIQGVAMTTQPERS